MFHALQGRPTRRLVHCLEYLMTHGGAVITVITEAATNREATALSSSESA